MLAGVGSGLQSVLDLKAVVKSIGPKLGFQGGTKQERAQPIANVEMRAFDRAILMGGVGTGGADFAVAFSKQFLDFRVVVKFTALVKEDILARALGGMIFQEVAEPMNRSAFRDPSITMFAA